MTAALALSVERLSFADPDVQQAWARIQLSGGVSTPFLTREWYSPFAEIPDLAAGCEVLAFRLASAIEGLLPIEIVDSNGLRILGVAGWHWLTPDHLDVIAFPERRHAAATAFAAHLASRRDWDVLDFDALAESSPLPDALRRALRGPQFIARAVEPVPVQIRRVAEDDAIVGKWARRRLRRAERTLEAEGGGLFTVAEPDSITDPLTALMDLHCTRFSDRSTLFANPERRHFHFRAAQALSRIGSAQVSRLRVGDDDAALLYSLSWNSTLYLYSSGLQPDVLQSAGSTLRDWMISRAASQGYAVVDFLRGCQPWKEQLSDQTLHDSRIRYVRTTRQVIIAGAGRWLSRHWDSGVHR